MMRTIDKSAGQNLKDFDKMMETIKPYLPPKMIIKEPKPAPHQPSETIPYDKKKEN